MKTILFLIATLCSLGLLYACASNPHGEAQPQAAVTPISPDQQAVDVKSPVSGQYNNIPNNGSTGAAKMIAPLTQ